MKPRTRAALGLAAGAVLALGAPPLEFWPSTFVAMGLLGAAVDGARPRHAALAGWIAGTAATLGSFYWIVGTVTRFTPLPLAVAVLAYLLLAGLTGAALGAAGFVGALCAPVLGAPVALGAGVLIAERYVPGIFRWQIAAPLIYAPGIPQAADVLGVSGLGAVLVAAMMVLARWVRWALGQPWPGRPAVGPLVAAVAVLAGLWGYGAVRSRAVREAAGSARTLRVALVQPAIEARARWDESRADEILEGLHAQTESALAHGADLVVWSEAAYPFVLPHHASIDGVTAPPVYPVPATVPILVGAITEDEEGHKYNSALLREPDAGISAPADKRALVPFGEYVPMVGNLSWVRRAFARASGITPGSRPTLLSTGAGLTLGVLNCFEDTMGYVAADLARADVLVNITNDAWFGEGAAPWAHLMLARWRAIETGRELLRAVNTGVTCRVNARGGLEQAAPRGTPQVLYAEARVMKLHPLAPVVIVYAPPAALAVAAAAAAVSSLRARRARRGGGEGS